MNKEVRPLEEYKEMIQNMSKDDMIKGLYDLSANIIEKSNEIERLNNIINELEKTLKYDIKKSQEYMDKFVGEEQGNYPVQYYRAEWQKEKAVGYLDKLKELKEKSDNND